MKYLNPRLGKGNILNANYSDVRNPDKKKSKFKKWIWRLLFLILLLLLLWGFHHFELAFETLQRINENQADLLNSLQQQVHNLELHNANLQIQTDMMKVKINGLELHNQAIHNAMQNIQSQDTPHINTDLHTYGSHATHTQVHNSSKLTAIGMLTVTAMGVFTALKGISSFVPAMP